MNSRKIIIVNVCALFFLCSFQSTAQAIWEKAYNGPNAENVASDILITSDGNYLGTSRGGFFFGKSQVVKTDPDGNTLWSQDFGIEEMQFNAAINTSDGGYALAGFHYSSPAENGVYLHKLDVDGNTLWFNEYSCCTDEANDIIQTPDGGYLMVGIHKEPPFASLAVRADANGDEIWTNTYYEMAGQSFHRFDGFRRMVVRSNGNYLMIGSFDGILHLTEIDDTGTEVWDTVLNDPQVDYLVAGDLELTDDGGVLIGAISLTNGLASGGVLKKFDADWNELWSKVSNTAEEGVHSLSENAQSELIIGRSNLVEKRDAAGNLICQLNENGNWNWTDTEVEATSDGGAIVAATLSFAPNSNLVLAKMNGSCVASVHAISGNVNVDEDGDCLFNGAGQNLENWVVELNDGIVSHFDLSDASGNYFFPAAPGNYDLTLHPPMPYWGTCATGLTVSVGVTPDTIVQDLQGTMEEECPYLFVDLASPPMRPCFGKNVSVYYENLGTDTAEDATLVISLDAQITINSASQPFIPLGGDQYEFNLGDLPPGESGGIIFEAFTDCDAPIGQELCLQANIYPDTICGGLFWAGAIIDVNGDCDGEEIDFEIKNIGQANMVNPLEFIVVEDDVMFMNSTFELNVAETFEFSIPNDHGTYATRADQEPGYPFGQFAVDVVAFCENPNNSQPFSAGFFNQFPLNNATPTEDVECVETVNSYDPNRLVAAPTGFGEDHIIENRTILEYHVDFQNTGTDTAYNIVIRDTLSTHLDLTTLRAGAASHFFELELEGNGILVFTFPQINLVDSLANEPGSHGFVEYRITTKPDLAIGTVVENTAAIYFDFNPPIFTNTTWHTIGEVFVTVDVDEPYQENLEMEVFPNPSYSHAVLRLKGLETLSADMELFSLAGQQVGSLKFVDGVATLDPGMVNAGIYLFRIVDRGQLIGTGKLVVK